MSNAEWFLHLMAIIMNNWWRNLVSCPLEADLLLAVDSSTQWVGLALYDGYRVLSEQVWQTHNHHTIELAAAVNGLLSRSEVQPGDLQALAVALGPGSFTSLRIGLAVVKGMAMALHLPVVGVPTLDILACSQPLQDLPMAAVLQAGRSRLAVAYYRVVDSRWQAQEPAKVMTVDELSKQIHSPTLICGELGSEDRHTLARKRKNVILARPVECLRRPSYLAEIAWERWQAGQVDALSSLAPIYLHIAGAIPV
jgi:tRNA threonylcarbamoyladenosine biosynthesis protein TsaB